MSSKSETILAEGNILAMNTFIHCFLSTNLSQLAPITIVVVFLPYLLVDLLLFQHIFFFFDFSDNVSRFFISAKWTFHHIIVLHLMLGPLTETLEVESISADCMAGSSDIALDYLHVTDGTEKIFILIIFFHYYIFS